MWYPKKEQNQTILIDIWTHNFTGRWQLARGDVFGGIGIVLTTSVLLHVGFSPLHFLGHLPGGVVGEYIGEISRALISTTGTLILAVTLMIVSLVALTRRSVFELAALSVQFARSTKTNLERASSRVTSSVGIGEVEALHEVDDLCPWGQTHW